MLPLIFIIPYSNQLGPVNTNWGLETGKYKLRAGATKYKLGPEAGGLDQGQGLGNTNSNKMCTQIFRGEYRF